MGAALLIQADFGPYPDLREVTETQLVIRSLLLALVDYEVSQVELLRPEPDAESIEPLVQILDQAAEEDSEVGAAVREILANQSSAAFAAVLSELVGRLPPTGLASLSISSSITVNPWQEVVQVVVPAVTTSGLAAAVARAAWLGLQNANAVLDVIVRVTTLKQERAARIAALDAEASSQHNDALREIINTSTHSAAASAVIDAILNVRPEVAGRVELRTITDEEAHERRQRALRVVRTDEDRTE